MKPINPLMLEHRLIERMVELVKEVLHRASEQREATPSFVEAAVDFFGTYVDRTRHGKEEDILIRDLARKKLSQEHKQTTYELMAEHILARETVSGLLNTTERYVNGNGDSLYRVIDSMQRLAELYPRHIEREDKGVLSSMRGILRPARD